MRLIQLKDDVVLTTKLIAQMQNNKSVENPAEEKKSQRNARSNWPGERIKMTTVLEGLFPGAVGNPKRCDLEGR